MSAGRNPRPGAKSKDNAPAPLHRKANTLPYSAQRRPVSGVHLDPGRVHPLLRTHRSSSAHHVTKRKFVVNQPQTTRRSSRGQISRMSRAWQETGDLLL